MNDQQTDRMRVAHVLAWISRNAGGLFTCISGLTRALDALGRSRIEVFGVRDAFSEEDRCQWSPLVVHTLPVLGPARLCAAPGMGRMIAAFAPNMIHSSAVWTYQAAVVNRLHDRYGTPYVLSTHGTLDPWALQFSHARKALARWLYQQRHFERAACIHALHKSELRSIRRYGLRNPVCIVPNGVEIPPLVNRDAAVSLHRDHPLARVVAAGRNVALHLGRIHPKKGLPNLLQAWARVCADCRDLREGWTLAIAGWDESGHEKQLKRQAGELGLSTADAREKDACLDAVSVVFLGPQYGDDKDACYCLSSVFVLASFSEGLPMSVLEAWAHALPVLLTPACNLPEGVETGAAHQVEPQTDALVGGLIDILGATDAERLVMGARGRELAITRFAWPQIARDMQLVYDWVLGGGVAPACVTEA